MKIYDCFIFFNEFDLLEIRLNLLYNLVDYFVIVEATTTFQNTPKPLFYEENKQRFEKFQDKIIHIKIDLPCSDKTWDNEEFQRNSIAQGLSSANNDDLIIISDVDELIRPEIINLIKNDNGQVYFFKMPYFNFKFNYFLINHEESHFMKSGAIKFKYLTSPQEFRMFIYRSNHDIIPGTKIVDHAGWHFSSLGDTEFCRTKLKSFSHDEFNYSEVLNEVNVEKNIKDGKGNIAKLDRTFVPVKLDNYFHDIFREDKYSLYVLPDATKSIYNYLK